MAASDIETGPRPAEYFSHAKKKKPYKRPSVVRKPLTQPLMSTETLRSHGVIVLVAQVLVAGLLPLHNLLLIVRTSDRRLFVPIVTMVSGVLTALLGAFAVAFNQPALLAAHTVLAVSVAACIGLLNLSTRILMEDRCSRTQLSFAGCAACSCAADSSCTTDLLASLADCSRCKAYGTDVCDAFGANDGRFLAWTGLPELCVIALPACYSLLLLMRQQAWAWDRDARLAAARRLAQQQARELASGRPFSCDPALLYDQLPLLQAHGSAADAATAEELATVLEDQYQLDGHPGKPPHQRGPWEQQHKEAPGAGQLQGTNDEWRASFAGGVAPSGPETTALVAQALAEMGYSAAAHAQQPKGGEVMAAAEAKSAAAEAKAAAAEAKAAAAEAKAQGRLDSAHLPGAAMLAAASPREANAGGLLALGGTSLSSPDGATAAPMAQAKKKKKRAAAVAPATTAQLAALLQPSELFGQLQSEGEADQSALYDDFLSAVSGHPRPPVAGEALAAGSPAGQAAGRGGKKKKKVRRATKSAPVVSEPEGGYYGTAPDEAAGLPVYDEYGRQVGEYDDAGQVQYYGGDSQAAGAAGGSSDAMWAEPRQQQPKESTGRRKSKSPAARRNKKTASAGDERY